MTIISGIVNQVVHFFAPPGLSGFVLYWKKDVGSWTLFGAPTVTEDDPANAPGMYSLLVNAGTTITVGRQTEQLAIQVNAPGMTTQLLTIEIEILRRETNAKEVNDTLVVGTGQVGVDPWRAA